MFIQEKTFLIFQLLDGNNKLKKLNKENQRLLNKIILVFKEINHLTLKLNRN